MINEEWRDINGFENRYQVSNHGRVRLSKSSRGYASGKILSVHLDEHGYPRVQLTVGYKKRIKKFIHRLVAQAFIPNEENKPEVNHIDGVRTNAYLTNLEWATREENNSHKNRILKSHANRRFYELISPEGNLVTTDNLVQFAEEQQMRLTSIQRVVYGQRKSYHRWRLA